MTDAEEDWQFTDKRIEEIGQGYDLDGGGYEFTRPDKDSPLNKIGRVLVYDGDWDYFPGVVDGREMLALSCPLCVFNPFHWGDPTPWPRTMPAPWVGDVYVLKMEGTLRESEHECSWCEATGKCQLTEDETVLTECERCEGSGYMTAAGGDYAVYGIEDADDLEVLAAALGGLV